MLIRSKPNMNHQPQLQELQLALSENIRVLRGKRGLSQERLALEAGVDRTLVSKIERLIANPTLGVLTKLAFVLEVPVIRLLKSSFHTGRGIFLSLFQLRIKSLIIDSRVC